MKRRMFMSLLPAVSTIPVIGLNIINDEQTKPTGCTWNPKGGMPIVHLRDTKEPYPVLSAEPITKMELSEIWDKCWEQYINNNTK